MRTIDILTTQNVTIKYELADVKDRIFATLIDIIIQSIALLLLALLLIGSGLLPNSTYFLYFIVFPVLFFYYFASEIIMDGQTYGKRMLAIKVVKLTGSEPSINDYLMRWALRPIDVFFSLGSICVMLVSSSEKGQRLGDIIANTTVIKLNPTQRINLADIMNIRTLGNYEPVYTQVRAFTEPEMILLKEVMDKSLKYKNKGHNEALEAAAQMVKLRLNLDKIPADRVAFLRTLIKDFVALSR